VSAVLYHPETQHTIVVGADAVPTYRLSGWLLKSEHEANEAQAAALAEAEAPKADKAKEK